MSYLAFKRTWWKENPSWPNGLEPCAGPRKYFDEEFETEDEAREFCQAWNARHEPGSLSLKAEYEEGGERMTKTKRRNIETVPGMLTAMLTENTGTHMLDSGGESGRAWQRNKGKTQATFENEPSATWEGDSYTISLYHYLKRDLVLDVLSDTFNREFVPAENWDSEIYGTSKEAEAWLKDVGFKIGASFNSYNGESFLSQVIQGTWLTLGEKHYLLLQIHGGADVRGGYTDARLFSVPDYEDGALLEEVMGVVTKKDGTRIEVDNLYDGYSLTSDGNGSKVEIEEGDKVEVWLME